jgi:UDP-N-acetylmuramyl pentapeptide phosphotransferase/UDP-N-acetylglucosamine-1-phosphate transferase
MSETRAVAVFLSSFATCTAVIWLLLRTRVAWRIATDRPNERSLHDFPVPRIGGFGVIPATIAVALLFGPRDWLLAAFAAVLFAVSFVDDRAGVPIAVRFVVHAAVAAGWLAFAPFELSLAIACTAGIGIVWITNLFNFMDGADGLAGGMALFAFSAYAIVASGAELVPLSVWSIAVAGGAAGFLLFNFNPARVFLGDAGSITIGFLAAAIGIWGWAANAWPLWFPFLVAAPFFLDASVTLLRRAARGERFWRAHREHYYQRLVQSGWSHRRLAVAEYLLMAASAGLAIAMLNWSHEAQRVGLACAAAVYAVLAVAVDRRWSRFRRSQAAMAATGAAREDGSARHGTAQAHDVLP